MTLCHKEVKRTFADKTARPDRRIKPAMTVALLDRLHRRLRANPLAYRLVIGTRILLCAGFLPTGMVKLLGRPFTVMEWDYHRWRGLLTMQPARIETPEPLPLSPFERLGYAMGAAFGLTFFLATRSLVPKVVFMPAMIGAAGAMLMVLALAAGRPWRSQIAR
jgi:hypothetical protein